MSEPIRFRPRRLRRTPLLRDTVAETTLQAQHLMMPYFVVSGQGSMEPIATMPGIYRWSIDRLLKQVEQGLKHKLTQVLLFGKVDKANKSQDGHYASKSTSVIAQAIVALKKAFGADLLVASDICLCGYTDHGHCGLLQGNEVDNDSSLAPLAAMALAHAEAGADMVAPSDMMDGRVGFLRHSLDQAGFSNTAIMAYSAKYASAYYGPFREAADSAPQLGDRRSYQMDPRNSLEALREVQLDIAEGADLVMVKPALAYLDVIWRVRQRSPVPVACYNVSGEYALVKAGAAAGMVDEAACVRENLLAMRRAGASLLISYHAAQALEQAWL